MAKDGRAVRLLAHHGDLRLCGPDGHGRPPGPLRPGLLPDRLGDLRRKPLRHGLRRAALAGGGDPHRRRPLPLRLGLAGGLRAGP